MEGQGTASLKVVLVGEETTGKTTIYRTLLHEQLDEKYKPSIGPPKQGTVAMTSATNDVDVALFDTGGQLRHRAFAISTLKEAKGVFLVYDVTRSESFQGMQEQEWLRHIRTTAEEGVPIILVGNKADKGLEESKRQVTKQEGEDYAKAHNLSFIEVSAKEEAEVVHLFQQMKNLLPK